MTPLFLRVARPESKGVTRKNHEARLISWTGRPSRSSLNNRVLPL
jgi:hypothetical protein